MSNSPDLAIIGSGSGNSLVTPFWDDKQVMLVEENSTFGGTCLNVGCIPTKMFVRAADTARTPEEAARLNVSMHTDSVDWSGLRDRVFGRIDPISEAGRNYRANENENVELVTERATLTGDATFTTSNGRQVTPKKLVIAAGSRPHLPNIPGIGSPRVHTSDTIMRLETQPKSILIIGGGYIACEFASIFSGLGTEVTQVIRGDRLLKQFDEEISAAFTKEASRQWTLITGASPVEIADSSSNATVHFSGAASGSTDQSISAEVILVATGRIPNTDRLGAAAAGFDIHDDGRLKVDQYLRVFRDGEPVTDVYALGDICAKEQLKHVANHQARVVSHNLEHPDDLRQDGLMPVVAAAFTSPEMSAVGLTEQEAVAQIGSENVTVRTQKYGDTAYGWALEDTSGICKVIADKRTGTILGAAIMGYQASNIIQPIVMAMSFNIDAYSTARGQFWPHPALSEVVENALLGLDVPTGQTSNLSA